jgi:hypothetical protein
MARFKSEELYSFLIYRISLIEKNLRDISLRSFPSESPRNLYLLIIETCKKIKDYLLSFDIDSEAFESAETEDQLIATSSYLNYILSWYIESIERSCSEYASWELVRPFESFAENIHGSKIKIVLRPCWELNFWIDDNVIPTLKNHLSMLDVNTINSLFQNQPDDVFIISYPVFDKTNILLQGNLGHELGHPWAKEYIEKTEMRDGSYAKEIGIIRAEIEQEKHIKEPERQVIERVRRVREGGLKELLCDLVSVRLFGIASLFSCYEFVKSIDDLDIVSSNNYPPWRMRLRLMYEALEDKGTIKKYVEYKGDTNREFDKAIISSLEEKLSSVKGITDIRDDEKYILSNPIYKIAYNSIKRTMPSVNRFLDGKVRSIEDNVKLILDLCNRLESNIPPNANEEDPFRPIVADIRMIMNSGWLDRIYKLSSCPKTEKERDEFIKGVDRLNRLVYKALELSDIYARWSETTAR